MAIELPEGIAESAALQPESADYSTVADFPSSRIGEQEMIQHQDSAELKALLDETKGQVGVPVDTKFWTDIREELERRVAERATV